MKSVTRPQVLRNRSTLVLLAAVALALSYAFITRAFDTGSYWQYGAALVFLVAGIRQLMRALRK